MVIVGLLVTVVVVFGLAVLALGIFLAWVAFATLARDVRIWVASLGSRKWRTTNGIVTRSVVTRSGVGRGVSFAPGIEYEYEAGGRSFSSTRLHFASSWPGASGLMQQASEVVSRFPKGSLVTVFYDPDDPARATLGRERKGFGFALLYFFLLSLAAAGVIPSGIHVLLGAVMDPPQFSESELPAASHQLAGLLGVVGAFAGLAGGIGRIRTKGRRLSLARLNDVPSTRLVDLEAGREVAIYGRAEVDTAGILVSPISGDPVIYYRVCVLASGDILSETVGHGDFSLRDPDGGCVRVSTDGGTDELQVRTLPKTPAVQAFIDATLGGSGLPIPADAVVQLRQIAPGDHVLLVGRPRRDTRTGELSFDARSRDPASLLFADTPLSDFVRRSSRGVRWSRASTIVGTLMVVFGLSLLAW